MLYMFQKEIRGSIELPRIILFLAGMLLCGLGLLLVDYRSNLALTGLHHELLSQTLSLALIFAKDLGEVSLLHLGRDFVLPIVVGVLLASHLQRNDGSQTLLPRLFIGINNTTYQILILDMLDAPLPSFYILLAFLEV